MTMAYVCCRGFATLDSPAQKIVATLQLSETSPFLSMTKFQMQLNLIIPPVHWTHLQVPQRYVAQFAVG